MSEQRKGFIVFLTTLFFTVVFFMTLNPDRLPVVLMLLPFIMIFLVLFTGLNLAIYRFLRFSTSTRRLLALVLSVLPVLLLVIQSITQLTIRDVIITVALLVLLVWYVTKSSVTA